jgi:hypothetical protein
MEIDDPIAKAELEDAFRRYEVALTTNDVAVLDELFKNAPYTVRYGATEVLHGYAEIAAFRAARPSQGLKRALIKTVITTFGRDFGTASTTFRREGGTKLGRQMQTWVRFPGEGWRVVAAHVSLMDEPAKP